MKQWALKSKSDFSFFSSAKHCKGFSMINDSVKCVLQKWILSHTYVIKSPIINAYIKGKFDDGNAGANTGLPHKVLLQLSICKIYIDTLKKYSTGFSMTYD